MPVDLPPDPQPSSSQSRSAFVSALSAMVDWFYTAIPQLRAALIALNFNSTNGTSSTSLSISLASKSLTADTSKSWMKGMSIKVAKDASNWMLGEVDSYDSGTGAMVFIPTLIRGAGTYSDWTISLAANAPDGSMVFLGSVDASASAQVDIEDDFDDYDYYKIIGTGINYNVATTAQLRARLKIGGSYDAASNYRYASDGGTSGGTSSFIILSTDFAGTGGEHVDFVMDIFNPSSALPKTINCDVTEFNGSSHGSKIRGNNSGTGALTGVRIYPSTGNISTGRFSLYGVRKNA